MSGCEDPRTWLTQTLSRMVLDAPENRLGDYGGRAVFDAPLVGVADADDPVFARLREVVAESHLLPRQVLGRGDGDGRPVRVVAWALPFTDAVRRSNRGGEWPSQMYSLARNNGGRLNHELRRGLAEAIRRRGWAAAAPPLTEGYNVFRSPTRTFASTWSERHVAYAAGLGRFGLHGALITPVGASVRLGSLVTDMPLPVTPRGPGGHLAPCAAARGDGCGRCIAACPVGAVSPDGLDKTRCYQMRQAVRRRFLDDYRERLDLLSVPVTKSGRTADGHSLGCALCQCGVPCEAGAPEAAPARGGARA